MKEKINHYGYSNLLIGRYAWYFFSIVTIKNSNLKFLEKINLIFKFILYNFPLIRNFFKKKNKKTIHILIDIKKHCNRCLISLGL